MEETALPYPSQRVTSWCEGAFKNPQTCEIFKTTKREAITSPILFLLFNSPGRRAQESGFPLRIIKYRS